jgi:hypothetical protein
VLLLRETGQGGNQVARQVADHCAGDLEVAITTYIKTARNRSVMEAEARRHGLALSGSRLASLQPLAGRNPAIARKVVRNEAVGLRQDRPEHTQYLDISPLILAATCTLGLLRFIGMGTGNKSLYIVGGVAMMIGLSLKYLGKIQGAKRRYGQ